MRRRGDDSSDEVLGQINHRLAVVEQLNHRVALVEELAGRLTEVLPRLDAAAADREAVAGIAANLTEFAAGFSDRLEALERRLAEREAELAEQQRLITAALERLG